MGPCFNDRGTAGARRSLQFNLAKLDRRLSPSGGPRDCDLCEGSSPRRRDRGFGDSCRIPATPSATDPRPLARQADGRGNRSRGRGRRREVRFDRQRIFRPRLRRVHGAVAIEHAGLALLRLQGCGDLHRWREPSMFPGEPDQLLGHLRRGDGVEPDAPLRRTSGAVRQPGGYGLDLAEEARDSGPARRRRRRQQGRAARPGLGEPDLLRHGGLQLRLARLRGGGGEVPQRLDEGASREGLRVGRLRQLRLDHERARPLLRQGILREPRRHLVRQLEQPSNDLRRPIHPGFIVGQSTSGSTSTRAATRKRIPRLPAVSR